jgi:2'-5' RNA ligase
LFSGKQNNKIDAALLEAMRAFIGIRIPENEKLAELLDKLSKFKNMKTVEPHNLHINLKFFEEINENDTERMKANLDKLSGSGKFTVKMKGVNFFPNEEFIKVVYIGVESEPLIKLNELIENEAQTLGFKKEDKAYAPHITLARNHSKNDEIKSLRTDEVLFEFNVTELEMLKSELTSFGPKYTVVKTVKL